VLKANRERLRATRYELFLSSKYDLL
jgi:hypothetical protein